MIPVGSSFLVSTVDLAVTPKPFSPPVQTALISATGTLSRYAKQPQAYQRHITHAEHHHALMFRRVFRYPTEMSFDDVIAVKKRELSGWFDPDLRDVVSVNESGKVMEVQAIVSTSPEIDSITSSDITKRTLYFAYLANQSRLVTPNL